jgi:hypothetical protein
LTYEICYSCSVNLGFKLFITASYTFTIPIYYMFFFSDVKANLTKIGFIGLGNMGSPMARNILTKVITAGGFQFKLQYFTWLKCDTIPVLWCRDVMCIYIPRYQH